MGYYNERNGFLPKSTKITIDDLRKYWLNIYDYFQQKGCFEVAEKGKRYGNAFIPLTLKPSPEQYFFTHIGKVNTMSVPTWKRNLSDVQFLEELLELNVDMGRIVANKPKKYKQS